MQKVSQTVSGLSRHVAEVNCDFLSGLTWSGVLAALMEGVAGLVKMLIDSDIFWFDDNRICGVFQPLCVL